MPESIVVITETWEEAVDKYNLFFDMLQPEVQTASLGNNMGRIVTPRYIIRFVVKDKSGMLFRGVRADALFNCARDVEFHNLVALPMLVNSRRCYWKNKEE
jgi:hypothetical protein